MNARRSGYSVLVIDPPRKNYHNQPEVDMILEAYSTRKERTSVKENDKCKNDIFQHPGIDEATVEYSSCAPFKVHALEALQINWA